mgnify:CR=1 FL=1
MIIEEQRKAFEAWAYSNKWNIFRVRDMGIDKYVDDFVDGAWHGWLASANREGYKLVPVEINNEIESAMFSSVARGEMPCDVYKAMIGACDE